MRQPLVTRLSLSRRGLPPNGHLHWAVGVEQLLHTLLGIGWSPSKLASFVAKGRQALTQTAAGVQLRLDFLRQEAGLTAEQAAKAFGVSFGYTLGHTKISSLQRGLEQLRATGLSAEQVRGVLKGNCQILTATPLLFKKKLDCLQGVMIFYSLCPSVCLLPYLASICCSCCIVYMADQAQHCADLDSHLWSRFRLQRGRNPSTHHGEPRSCIKPIHRNHRGKARSVGEAAGSHSCRGEGDDCEAPTRNPPGPGGGPHAPQNTLP